MTKANDGSSSTFERLLTGDQAALARAISLLETGGPSADALTARLRPHTGRSNVIAVTGPPGAGKSTLIDTMISKIRLKDENVAVLAVDPSSPLSGGAILGDRTRMGTHSGDKNVFIRSIAARGHLGGLALSVPAILDAVDAAGWPTVILETVGAGQSETEVAEFADIKIVVNAPGLGDGVQAIKAGILEIADILVVNKSDLPLASRTVQQLKGMLELRRKEDRNVPIISTVAPDSTGIVLLLAEIDIQLAQLRRESDDERIAKRLNRTILRRAEKLSKSYINQVSGEQMKLLSGAVRKNEKSIDEAAHHLLISQILDHRNE